jgi:hypothetical protein
MGNGAIPAPPGRSRGAIATGKDTNEVISARNPECRPKWRDGDGCRTRMMDFIAIKLIRNEYWTCVGPRDGSERKT